MSQTLTASTLLAVPLAPLVGAVLAGIFGTTFGGNWIGRRLSHTLTILGVLIAFILSAHDAQERGRRRRALQRRPSTTG